MRRFTLAIARRGNITAVAVMDGPRIFDLLRIRAESALRIGRRLDEHATFYEAGRLVVEAGAMADLGHPSTELPRTAYELALVNRTVIPDYAWGDGARVHETIRSRYPELLRFLPRGRLTRPEHTSIVAAVALGLTHHTYETNTDTETGKRPSHSGSPPA